MLIKTRRKTRRSFANDFSILNPTIWAQEAISQLLPNMVLGNLVNRDFDNTVAKFGDIVNALVPSQFVMTRKGDVCENVVVQDASASSVQVALNQWPQVSFLICDGEENRNQVDLIDSLLTPAVIALSTGIDRILSNQVYHFLQNVGGHANLGDSTNIRQYMLETREKLNRANVPLTNRIALFSPSTETAALSTDAFTLAQNRGDNGKALTEAAIGRIEGFDTYMSQTQPEVAPGQAALTPVLINGATAAGSTVIPIDGAGTGTTLDAVLVGSWLLIAGDDMPHQIIANSGAGGTVTINTPLNHSVADNAVVTILKGGLVNNSGGYRGTTTSPRLVGWAKEIVTDTWTAGSPPQIGQMVTFGADTNRYTIIGLRTISSTAYGITLDVPLVTAIADNAVINLGPAAKYNFMLNANALVLVNRPPPTPRAGTGAISRVISDPRLKLALRVTITYDGQKQGHLVTLDTFMGVGVLNQNLGAVMLA